MKKAIPMTGSPSTIVVDPDLEKFRATIARLWEKTLASGKVRILSAGADTQNDRRSTSPKTAPAPPQKAPEPRRAPPARPTYKRPSALTK